MQIPLPRPMDTVRRRQVATGVCLASSILHLTTLFEHGASAGGEKTNGLGHTYETCEDKQGPKGNDRD